MLPASLHPPHPQSPRSIVEEKPLPQSSETKKLGNSRPWYFVRSAVHLHQGKHFEVQVLHDLFKFIRLACYHRKAPDSKVDKEHGITVTVTVVTLSLLPRVSSHCGFSNTDKGQTDRHKSCTAVGSDLAKHEQIRNTLSIKRFRSPPARGTTYSTFITVDKASSLLLDINPL